jgi:hypothetical protein
LSEPVDVRKRLNAKPTDGCISFLVKHVRFKEMATPCHDPLENNYSHSEVRQLLPEEDVFTEPPKNRKLKKSKDGWSRSQRLEYRQHLVFNKRIEIQAEA